MAGTDIMTGPTGPTGPTASPLRRVLTAPFSRRTWTELWYVLVSVPLAVAGFAFTVATLIPPLLAVSAPGVRKFGDASRGLARELLGEDVPAPPPLRPEPHVHVRTPDAARLAALAATEGARVRRRKGGRVRRRRSRVRISGLPASRVAELASANHIPINESRQHGGRLGGAMRDRTAWRARGYLVLKLPLALAGLAAAAVCWLGGLLFLIFPALWALMPPLVSVATSRVCRGSLCVAFPAPPGSFPDVGTITHRHVVFTAGAFHVTNLADSFALVPLGAALLLAAPWVTRAFTKADRSLIRGLLGPASLEERVRALQETRARAVDDSAARLRGIERDLHDGTQAQLVALAMKLGLAKEKLGTATPADMARATELVDDAHRGVIEAIADLRVLARGIHPPVLDNGLADALATLAARSALPVELVTDIPERPSAAIETIAYFSAAELLTNAAKHSGARHVTLEAIHVPGLLRIRVSDDGNGGARPVPRGGLRGLADRVRTVDGRLDISSPLGGPTVVTVELPSHA
jgi:signal transduction histidine kinase